MKLTVQGREAYAYTGGKHFDPDKPCVVFIHGALNDHSVWALQSRYLANHGFGVLALDLPGHGRSAGPALGSIEELAQWLLDLLRSAGVSRTAEIAYTMGSEAAPVLVDHDRGRLRIVAIYHSHPQHDAYFSAEDRKQATIFDEPSYPDAAQIVVSVYDGEVKAVKAFGWNDARRDFEEIALAIES